MAYRDGRTDAFVSSSPLLTPLSPPLRRSVAFARSNVSSLAEITLCRVLVKETRRVMTRDVFHRSCEAQPSFQRTCTRDVPRERESPPENCSFRSFSVTSISRFCHRDPTSDVASPGTVTRFGPVFAFPDQGRSLRSHDVVDRFLQRRHDT
jgi:hypothetical protein